MKHEKEFEEAVKSALNIQCFRDSNGEFYAEIYADYRDELDDSILKEIMDAKNPREEFYEKLYEWYNEYAWQLKNAVIDKVLEDEDVSEYVYNCAEDDTYDSEEMYTEDEAIDIIRDMFYVRYPDEHFLDQNICVDVFVDTGDANYDFTCNNFGPHYNAQGETIMEESSLLWLARQQGYTKTQLKRAAKERPKEKGFLQSVYDEINNCGSSLNSLTFLVEMSFGEFLDLCDAIEKEDELNRSYTLKERHGNGYIVLSADTNCGLFDKWDGAGSIFEIKLDKDVKLPIKCIFKAVPDCCLHYGVKDVYGACDSFWNGTIKEVHKMHRKG